MDLVIAAIERPTIINEGRLAIDSCRRQAADGQSSVVQFIQEVAVGRANGCPEGIHVSSEESRATQVVGIALLLGHDAGVPGLEAIDVRRLNGVLGMEPAWLAAVFDINAEDHVGGFVALSAI